MPQPDRSPSTPTGAQDTVDHDRCSMRRFEIRAEVESLLMLDLAARPRWHERPAAGATG